MNQTKFSIPTILGLILVIAIAQSTNARFMDFRKLDVGSDVSTSTSGVASSSSEVGSGLASSASSVKS